MLFLALAAGGAAVLEVHRAIHGKASSDPGVLSMQQRERELKDALAVRLRAPILSYKRLRQRDPPVMVGAAAQRPSSSCICQLAWTAGWYGSKLRHHGTGAELRRRCQWSADGRMALYLPAQAAQQALAQEQQRREREQMAAETLTASVRDLEAKAADLQASDVRPAGTASHRVVLPPCSMFLHPVRVRAPDAHLSRHKICTVGHQACPRILKHQPRSCRGLPALRRTCQTTGHWSWEPLTFKSAGGLSRGRMALPRADNWGVRWRRVATGGKGRPGGPL